MRYDNHKVRLGKVRLIYSQYGIKSFVSRAYDCTSGRRAALAGLSSADVARTHDSCTRHLQPLLQYLVKERVVLTRAHNLIQVLAQARERNALAEDPDVLLAEVGKSTAHDVVCNNA